MAGGKAWERISKRAAYQAEMQKKESHRIFMPNHEDDRVRRAREALEKSIQDHLDVEITREYIEKYLNPDKGFSSNPKIPTRVGIGATGTIQFPNNPEITVSSGKGYAYYNTQQTAKQVERDRVWEVTNQFNQDNKNYIRVVLGKKIFRMRAFTVQVYPRYGATDLEVRGYVELQDDNSEDFDILEVTFTIPNEEIATRAQIKGIFETLWKRAGEELATEVEKLR
jgi:hypothetical protein